MTITAIYILSFLVIPLFLIHGGIMDGHEAILSCLLTMMLYACVFMVLSL
jgi:hypothetical protein